MGVDVVFFAAADDTEAASAERRPGGPLGLPVQTGLRRVGLFRREPVVVELGPAFDGVPARGYDPVVSAGTLEELLTGRPYDDVAQDPRWGRPTGDGPPDAGGEVLTTTDALRDALAAASPVRLREVAERWSRTEELQQPGWEDVSVEDHLALLRALQGLAQRAVRDGRRLYAFVGP